MWLRYSAASLVLFHQFGCRLKETARDNSLLMEDMILIKVSPAFIIRYETPHICIIGLYTYKTKTSYECIWFQVLSFTCSWANDIFEVFISSQTTIRVLFYPVIMYWLGHVQIHIITNKWIGKDCFESLKYDNQLIIENLKPTQNNQDDFRVTATSVICWEPIDACM